MDNFSNTLNRANEMAISNFAVNCSGVPFTNSCDSGVHSCASGESVDDGDNNEHSILRKLAGSLSTENYNAGESHKHFRHHSDEHCGAKFIDNDRFTFHGSFSANSAGPMMPTNDMLCNSAEASSSSFSIGSLSDNSISLPSVGDDLYNQSWCCSSSKQSSLDRRSFCSDSCNNSNDSAKFSVLGSLSSIFPKTLFLRKNCTSEEKKTQDRPCAKSTNGFVSTSALIFENRPAHLPAKTLEEEEKQRNEYAKIVLKAKKLKEQNIKERNRETKEQAKREERTAALVREWSQEILPHWNKLRKSKRVNELWNNGLPSCVRGKVWLLAIGNEMKITEDLFQICLSRAKELFSQSTERTVENDKESSAFECKNYENTVELIHLDLARTFPTLGIFQQGGPFYNLLLDLLSAYACFRPDIGYLQGMSFVAAVFLLNLDLYDAFVAFCNIMNSSILLAFFRLQHYEMEQYFIAYENLFKQTLSKLHWHFESLEIKPNLYLIDWLYTLFARSLPLDVTCRVWDMFFRDGDEYLFGAALGILSTYESVLLTMDFDRAMSFLTRLPEKMNADELFKRIRQIMSRFDRERMFLFR